MINPNVFSEEKYNAELEHTPKKREEQPGICKKLSIYLGYFSPVSFMWCCFWRKGTTITKKIKKIRRIQ
jgi:hypothetical protein